MRRVAVILMLLPLAACAGGPRAIGITGPDGATPEPAAAPAPANDPFENPDTLQSGTRYGPSYGPSTSGGHFWGYD